MKKYIFVFIIICIIGIGYYYYSKGPNNATTTLPEIINDTSEKKASHPLSIEYLREKEYPGSEVTIEETLSFGSNYSRYIASYKSEGYKIYALLTIPTGEKPESGWPVIIFNHGYIPPAQYRTTERYIAYTDAFSRNGYIVFRSDYRGHGNSEGMARGGYGNNDYTVDILNAVATMKKYKDADPNRIGMWGHSMGGHITLRSMVVNKDIKAGVIWGGVVASYPDLMYNWRRGSGTTMPSPPGARPGWRQNLLKEFGTPEENQNFWDSISSTAYLTDISGPIQLHHGTADTSVPVEFSEKLHTLLKEKNKISELYTYQGDDHDITYSFNTAIQRSVEFFNKYLKGK